MSYLALKHLHMSFAALSGALFFIRGILMLRRADGVSPRKSLLDRGSHIIDTILLASALTMVVWSAQYPFVLPWLTAKVIAVVVDDARAVACHDRLDACVHQDLRDRDARGTRAHHRRVQILETATRS